MCVNSLFTQATHTHDRLRHVHHMENHSVSSDRKFLNQICCFTYSWSGFPLAPLRQVAQSDCSSLEFPNHLGHVFFTKLGIDVLYFDLPSPSCRGWLVTNNLVRNDTSFRTRSTLCRYQVFRCLCCCFCCCFCLCLVCGLCSCLCSCPCRCLCCRLCCFLFCCLCSCSCFLPLPLLLPM